LVRARTRNNGNIYTYFNGIGGASPITTSTSTAPTITTTTTTGSNHK
jgi:uncharacterized membrane protein YdcZ (DUF606 family)